jgi:hypothetical protein
VPEQSDGQSGTISIQEIAIKIKPFLKKSSGQQHLSSNSAQNGLLVWAFPRCTEEKRPLFFFRQHRTKTV